MPHWPTTVAQRRCTRLLTGSVAVDAGDDVAATGLIADQRGLPRIVGAVDLGAVEKQDGEAGAMVNTFNDVVDANDGVVSLREAVIAANGTANPDVIILMPGTYRLTLAGSGEDAAVTGDLDIVGSLSIVGAGEQTVIDASALGDRVFELFAGSDATLAQLTVTGGQADDGGAIYNRGGTLEVTKSTLTKNVANGASGSGGAIFGAAGSLTTVSDSTISANLANRAGGGIEDASGAGLGLILNNVIFETNNAGIAPATAAPGNGGALHITGPGDVAITGGRVINNIAAREGGGLWNGSGLMTVDGVMIAQNSAAGDAADDGGGGIFNNGGMLEVDSVVIHGNKATGASGSGGGIFSTAGSVTVNASDITGNVANRAGGGIEIVVGSLSLTATNLGGEMDTAGNIAGPQGSAAPGNGGGLHVSGVATIAINGGTVRSNSAAREGGGLWNQVGATMTITDGTTIIENVASGNAADDGGGGIFDNGGTLVIGGSAGTVTIADNLAIGSDARGGGILSLNGVTRISSTTMVGNVATSAALGAGLTQHGGSALLVDSVIADAVAATGTARLAGGGNLEEVVLLDSATLAPGDGLAVLKAGDVTFANGTAFAAEIGGTTAGAGGHDQLSVGDGIDLSGASLNLLLASGYVPAATDAFVIVDNASANPVMGMFAGLPEDAFFAFGARTFRIDYSSGDGNDIALLAAEQDGVNLAISGPPALNNATGFFEQMVTLTNTQGTVAALDRLYISGLPEGVTVQNAAGSAPYGNPAMATPYIFIGAPIAPGASTALTVQFASADHAAEFSPAYNIDAGIGNVDAFEVTTILFLGEDVLVEFGSQAGVVYEVQYSTNLIDWTTVSPQLVGDAGITSWIDSGSPATESTPLTAGERYYRVVRVSNP